MPLKGHSTMLVGAVAVSVALWLGISSVTADAVHVLAKSDFRWSAFGSVSIRVLALGAGWALLSSLLLFWTAPRPPRVVRITAFAVVACGIVSMTGAGLADALLVRMGIAAIGLWVIEVAAGFCVAWLICRFSTKNDGAYSLLWATVATFAWLMSAKILFLLLAPGISIRWG